MNRSFRPRAEILEDRLVMDGSNTLLAGERPPTMAEPLPVLMVIANRDFYMQDRSPGLRILRAQPQATDGYAGTHVLYQDVVIPAAPSSDGNVIYVSTAGGGVWKTTDGGMSWGWGTWELNLGKRT